MKNISLDISKAAQFLSEGAVKAFEPQVKAAQEALEAGTCPGNDFLGWLHLPSSITPEFLDEVQATADLLRANCDAVVVAGIGGSYLGAKAVIEALSNSFAWLVADKSNPVILFAGNNIGEDYLSELTEYLKGKKFGVINISKSGTTTETALTFRLLKKQCEEQMGKDMARKVIVAVTDAKRGAARTCADKEGYKSFVIPDNVGGRFSVLTPVGLLPIACAGFDIKELVAGAAEMEKACGKDVAFDENPAAQYAAVRNGLYQAGKKIEIMVNYQPKLHWPVDTRRRAHHLRDRHQRGAAQPQTALPQRRREPRRPQLPCRQTGRRGEQDGRTRHPSRPCGWWCAQHPHFRAGAQCLLHRPTHLLLRSGLRHQRQRAGRQPVQPARRGGLQEEHVCPSRQARL